MHTNRTTRIKRGFIAAILTFTIGVAASPAQATDGDETDTTVVERPSRGVREAAKAERAAQRDALRKWMTARREIERIRVEAVRSARETMAAAIQGATERDQVRAARDAYKRALADAKAAYENSIAALGPRPGLTK